MIGVFDSGHGGLTILRGLRARLPERAFVYLGDHAHAPYGAREPEAIYTLTRGNVERLFSIGCCLVLLACNTASAVALCRLQQTWLPRLAPENRVLGVVVPTIEAVTAVPWHVTSPPEDAPGAPRRIAVYATRRTVESGSFPQEIARRAPALRVVQQPCPGLVDRIEADAPEAEVAAMIRGFVAASLEVLGGAAPDTAILGCTHYPLVARHFAQALPAGTERLDQAGLVAESLEAYLARHPEFNGPEFNGPEFNGPEFESQGPRAPAVRFFTTGDPARVDPLATRFFGAPAHFERLSETLS